MDDPPLPSRGDNPIPPPPKSDARDPSASSGSSSKKRKRKRQQVEEEEEEPGDCDVLYDEQKDELNGDGNHEETEEEDDDDDDDDENEGDEEVDDGDEGDEEAQEEEGEDEEGVDVDDEQEAEVDGEEEEQEEEDPNEGDENVEQEEEEEEEEAPHPLRYLALYSAEEKRRRRGRNIQSNKGMIKDPPAPAAVASSPAPAAGAVAPAEKVAADAPSDDEKDGIQAWEEELVLARHNGSIRERIRDCHRRAAEHQQAIHDLQGMIYDCELEAIMLEQQLYGTMVLPKIHDRRKYGEDFEYDIVSPSSYWDRNVSDQVKRSKELAWALLGTDDDEPLPLSFQQMLWMDPTYPLRKDREILLASIDKGLDFYRISIVWNQELANDRELVLKCFERCPTCISTDRNTLKLMTPYLKDMEALRAFAFAPERHEIHVQFSPELFEDPTFMADLVVHLCRKRHDPWAQFELRKAFPHLDWDEWRRRHWSGKAPSEPSTASKVSTKIIDGTLLDNVDFVIRVAEVLALLSPDERQRFPVKFVALPVPVRRNPEVALAFAKIDPSELWPVAAEHDLLAIFQGSHMASPYPNLQSSKAIVLHLLEASRRQEYQLEYLQGFAKFFLKCPPSIQNDREINMQLVVASAMTPSVKKIEQGLAAAGWVQRHYFWTGLAEIRRCPCTAWDLIPQKLACDERLLRTWARWARPAGAIDWMAGAVANFPNLGLLSDRKVLLNWIPQLCSDHAAAKELWRQVPKDKLGKSFWLKLFQTLDPPQNLLRYIPERLRSDPGIVDAQLQCAAKDEALLAECFLRLPRNTRFVPRIVQAIQNSDLESFSLTWRYVSDAYKLYHLPDAVLAILAKGWSFDNHVLSNLAWRNDPEFLLAVADVTAKHPEPLTFWNCCPDALRRDKAFVLRVLKGKNVPKLMLQYDCDLENDFDVQFALLYPKSKKGIREYFGDGRDADPIGEGCRFSDQKRTEKSVRFCCEVRARLQSYVSLETFLSCVQSTMSNCIPASFLGQDEFKQRLVEYVGCASISHDEALDLRRLSNKLTLAGY